MAQHRMLSTDRGSVFQDAVSEALARQPWYAERKNTLAGAANGILQMLNVVALIATDMPEWVNLIILGVGFIAEILVHAGTKGSITPSMAERLEEANVEAQRANSPTSEDVQEYLSGEIREHATSAAEALGLPVYTGPTTREE